MSDRIIDAPAAARRGWFDWLVTASGISVGIAIFLIGILVSYDVIGRAAFRLSNSWVTELTTYLMGYITFVGAAYALREGTHVNVDLMLQKLAAGPGRRLRTVADVATIAVVACLTWLSFNFFREAWATHEMSGTLLSAPLWIPYLSLFVGMAWLLIVAIASLVATLRCRDGPGVSK